MPDPLIALADKIEAVSEGSNAPVLIHCRAGVGRTGTLISFIVARKLIVNELDQGNGPVTIAMIARTLLNVVAQGRLGRGPQFVQTWEQFYSAADALALHFSRERQALPQPAPSGRSAGQQQSVRLRRALNPTQQEVNDTPLMNKDAPSLDATKHEGIDNRPTHPLPPIPEEGVHDMDSAERLDGTVDPNRSPCAINARFAVDQLSGRENTSISSTKKHSSNANDSNNVVDAINDIADYNVIDANIVDSIAANIGAANTEIADTFPANTHTASIRSTQPENIPLGSNVANLANNDEVDIDVASGHSVNPHPVNANVSNANTGNFPDPVDPRRSVSKSVAALWNALSSAATEPLPALHHDTIEQAVTGLPCIEATAVSVMIDGTPAFLHANRIVVTQLPTDAQPDPAPHHYIAGQSPKHFTTSEKLLLKAIESREGIFQLVSPATHRRLLGDCAKEEKKLSVAPILMQLLAKSARGEEIIIGNRYRVIPTKRENTADHIASYDLQIRALASNEEFTLPITQIGLKFDNAVLEAEEIRAANAALDQHLQHGASYHLGSGKEPIIISRKGVGRNATLIAYHEILRWIRSGEIDSDASLDAALQFVILDGRQARSVHFVHSAMQLQELRNALLKEIAA